MNPPAVHQSIVPYVIPPVVVREYPIYTFDEAAIRAAITLHRCERITKLETGKYSEGWHADIVLDQKQAHALQLDRFVPGMFYSMGILSAWARIEGEVSFKGIAIANITGRRAKLEKAADAALTPVDVAACKEHAVERLVSYLKAKVGVLNGHARLGLAGVFSQVEHWEVKPTFAQLEAEAAASHVEHDLVEVRRKLRALELKADTFKATIFAERKKTALAEMSTIALPVGVPEEWRATFLETLNNAAPAQNHVRYLHH